jgi:hypothetical protein
MLEVLEWSSTVLGLLGGFMVASHSRMSRLGWIVLVVGDVALIAFALMGSHYGVLVRQAGFTATSLLGAFRARAKASAPIPA